MKTTRQEEGEGEGEGEGGPLAPSVVNVSHKASGYDVSFRVVTPEDDMHHRKKMKKDRHRRYLEVEVLDWGCKDSDQEEVVTYFNNRSAEIMNCIAIDELMESLRENNFTLTRNNNNNNNTSDDDDDTLTMKIPLLQPIILSRRKEDEKKENEEKKAKEKGKEDEKKEKEEKKGRLRGLLEKGRASSAPVCRAPTEIWKNGDFPEIVRLNVGGVEYTTLLTTLQSDKSSMLAAMFSGRHRILTDEQGRYFIDRNGGIFALILDWLRSSNVPPPTQNDGEKEALLREAKYFGLQRLVEGLEEELGLTNQNTDLPLPSPRGHHGKKSESLVFQVDVSPSTTSRRFVLKKGGQIYTSKQLTDLKQHSKYFDLPTLSKMFRQGMCNLSEPWPGVINVEFSNAAGKLSRLLLTSD